MDGFGNHFVGEIISNKKLVSYEGKNKHSHHIWKWLCLFCHNEYGPSTIGHLKRSTKCIHCNSGENNKKWKGYKELTGSWLFQYRHDAKKKNRDWLVSPEYLWNKWLEQNGRCAYTGIDLHHGENASLDRVDSSLGYIEGNVQWVHRNINRMKSNFTDKEFVNMCEQVSKYRKASHKAKLSVAGYELPSV
jgi:hypothetical protein